MADNTALNPGQSGDTIRTIQRSSGGAKTEVVQLDFGGEPNTQASTESFVTNVNPLPVQDPVSTILANFAGQTLSQQYAQGTNANGFVPVETPGFLAGVF